jgi:hypothetical protein
MRTNVALPIEAWWIGRRRGRGAGYCFERRVTDFARESGAVKAASKIDRSVPQFNLYPSMIKAALTNERRAADCKQLRRLVSAAS